jgi:fluoride ion exporter CrcB/FEX
MNAETTNAAAPMPSGSGDQPNEIQQRPLPIDDDDSSPAAPMDITENWAEFSGAWETKIAEPGRKALHDFFYPSRLQQQQNSNDRRVSIARRNSGQEVQQTTLGNDISPNNDTRESSSQGEGQTNDTLRSPRQMASPRRTIPIEQDPEFMEQERQDKSFIESFWTTYDDIIILSLFTQIGILCRLGTASGFRIVDSVFRHDSALFTNLPLNCLSCFVMGLLCSGESLMEIVSTRFTPPRLQQDIQSEGRQKQTSIPEEDIENLPSASSTTSLTSPRWRGKRQRKKKTNARTSGWRPQDGDFQGELREVQLLALERRIRASPCLVLFHVRKEDVDVVENYFNEGYRGKDGTEEERKQGNCKDAERFDLDDHDLTLDVDIDPVRRENNVVPRSALKSHHAAKDETENNVDFDGEEGGDGLTRPRRKVRILPAAKYAKVETQHGTGDDNNENAEELQQQPDFDQMISNVATDVSEQISRISRVSLADGWDVGTSPEEKSKDLMLGLRDGLCGALSSFSSWISSMVSLLRGGKIGEAVVGLVLGIQLPLVAYRFGQHAAVYIFVWRCRRETRRDERRGYGIRLSMDEDDSDDDLRPGESSILSDSMDTLPPTGLGEESETPSVRAIISALFILSIVAQITSLNFYYEPEDRLIALSLLFSPLGVLTRWRLSKFNNWRPSFPIGTFACNISACALSGTLGSLLAGNPDPRERIALVSLIAGFGGTLSSVARFIVEVLAGVDPILFRADGVNYAVISVCSGLIISFLFTASVDWADNTEKN